MRNPQATLSTAHRFMPEAIAFLALSLLSSGLAVAVFSKYQLLWLLPVWLDPWSLPILYTSSAGLLAYLAAASIRIAYASAHEQRHLLAVAIVVLLLAFAHLYIRHAMPVYSKLYDDRNH